MSAAWAADQKIPMSYTLPARSAGARRFVVVAALAAGGVLGRPAHQRRIVMTEQHAAEPDRGRDLGLPVGARARLAATQRLHQRFRGLLDILLQVGMAPQRHLVDGELAGIIAADRDEIDQGCGFLDLAAVDTGARRNVLVGA